MNPNNVKQLNPRIENKVLILLHECLQKNEIHPMKAFQMSKPNYAVSRDSTSKDISEKIDCDTDSLRTTSTGVYDALNIALRCILHCTNGRY